MECNPLLDELLTVSWNSKSNKTPVIWQGSRIRCNTCRDLQSKRSSSCRETDKSYFTLCGEKKPSLKNSRMQQLFTYSKGKGILKSVNSSKDPCQGPTESIEWTPRTVGASTRKPVWIQERQRNNRHDLYSTTVSRKMPGTECGPLHDICRPYQSIWHSQSRGTLENYGKVRLSCQIYSNGAAVPWWYACKGPKWRRVFWSFPCDKWS